VNGFSGFSAWPQLVVIGCLALLDYAVTELGNELSKEVEK
jgi:hypothetical protein